MRIPESDKLVAELSQVFIHGKAPFLKNAVAFFDHCIDHIPGREEKIDRDSCLFRSPDKGLPEKTDALPYTIFVYCSCLHEIP